MKIYADMFKKWSKVLEMYQTKGDPYGESMLFDFENKNVYFGTDLGQGKLKFFYDLNQNEEVPKKFFISINKFLGIITKYDYLEFDGNSFFNGKDKFKFSMLEYEPLRINLSIFKDNIDYKDITKDTLKKISDAILFINKDDPNDNLKNIFIKNGKICSLSSKTPIYESAIDYSEDLAVEYDVAKLMTLIGNISEGCKILQNMNSADIKSIDDEIEMIVPNKFTTDYFDTDKELNGCNYATKIEFDTSIFNNNFSFIKPYFNPYTNSKVYLTFDTDAVLKIDDDSTQVEKHFDYKTISDELKNKTFSFSGTKMDLALSLLKGKDLTLSLPIDENQSLITISNDTSQRVIMTRFKD